jgi:uncharacterized repeat protein (TIGR02543 family)
MDSPFKPLNQNTRSILFFFIGWIGFSQLLWAQSIPVSLNWTSSTDGILFSSPTIDSSGKIFIGSNDNKLHAISSADGSSIWTFTTGSWVDTTPALSHDESVVYFGSWDNKLYAVHAQTGAEIWSFETNSYIQSSPAVGLDGKIYFGSMDSIFYALEANGSLAWEYFAGEPIFSSPAIGPDGTLYFGDENGTLHALNSDGSEKWTYLVDEVTDANRSILSSPTLDAVGNLYFGSGNGYCYSISDNGSQATLNWKYLTGDRVDASPALGLNEEVFFVSRDGYMRSLPLFSATTDNLANWEVLVGDVFYSSPVVDENGRVYVIAYTGGGENHLFAYDADGTKAWDSNVSNPPFTIPSVVDSSLLLSDDGDLYFGCFDKNLYSLSLGVPPANSGWPMFRRNSIRNGDWPSFSLTLQSSPDTGGTTTGQGQFYEGSTPTITATPNTGYSFTGWTGDGVTDPNASTTTVSMTEARTLSASFSINSYELSLQGGVGGSVSGSGTFDHGSTPTITATPNTGYSFSGWTGDGVSDPNASTTTVSMNEARTLSASFSINSYELSLQGGVGGSVSGSGTFDHGSTPTITATPNTGYSFSGWTGDGVSDPNASTTTVSMNEARTLSASFSINSYDLTLVDALGGSVSGSGTFDHGSTPTISATPNTGYSFSGWTGDGVSDPNASTTTVSMNEARTLSASFSINSYELTLVDALGGSVSGSGTFDHGSTPTITATPNTGYSFSGWTGDGVSDPNASTTTVSMTEARTLSASFSINSYDLTLVDALGGSVSGSGTFDHGSTPTITATPNTGYSFSGWTGDGVSDPNASTTTVSMNEARTLSASFSINSYDLTLVDALGGSVSGSGTFDHGSTPTIAAVANSGYSFSGWLGMGVSDPNSPTTSVLLTENQSISAQFTEISASQYLLTLQASPPHAGILTGGGLYPVDQNVTITASPLSGYAFDQWTGASISTPEDANSSLIIDGNLTLTALFNPLTYSVIIEDTTGGTVSGAGNYTYGTEANLSAIPSTGYQFEYWNGGGVDDPLLPDLSLIVQKNLTLEAVFSPKNYHLHINPTNGGSVYISGNSPFLYDSNVSINAVPNPGYTFSRWIGQGVHSESESNSFVHMTEDRNISAFFETIEASLITLKTPTSGGVVTGAGFYQANQFISLSATPNPGYRFSHWLGAGVEEPLKANTRIFITSDAMTVASFSLSQLSQALEVSNLGNNWFSSWLGTIYQTDSGWIYHWVLGWLYPQPLADNLWLWTESHGWAWTAKDPFSGNFLWFENLKEWVYLDLTSTHAPRYYNYQSESWVDW